MKKPEMKTITINGIDINYYSIDTTYTGIPRLVVHFTDLGLNLNDYEEGVTGLTKYRGKWFGGGYVIQNFDDKRTLETALKLAQIHLNEKHKN